MDESSRQRLSAITSQLDRLYLLLTEMVRDAQQALAREDADAAVILAAQITGVLAQIRALTEEWAELAKGQ
jgi:hypothetical protein